jgi:hypothetical protein
VRPPHWKGGRKESGPRPRFAPPTIFTPPSLHSMGKASALRSPSASEAESSRLPAPSMVPPAPRPCPAWAAQRPRPCAVPSARCRVLGSPSLATIARRSLPSAASRPYRRANASGPAPGVASPDRSAHASRILLPSPRPLWPRGRFRRRRPRPLRQSRPRRGGRPPPMGPFSASPKSRLARGPFFFLSATIERMKKNCRNCRNCQNSFRLFRQGGPAGG